MEREVRVMEAEGLMGLEGLRVIGAGMMGVRHVKDRNELELGELYELDGETWRSRRLSSSESRGGSFTLWIVWKRIWFNRAPEVYHLSREQGQGFDDIKTLTQCE